MFNSREQHPEGLLPHQTPSSFTSSVADTNTVATLQSALMKWIRSIRETEQSMPPSLGGGQTAPGTGVNIGRVSFNGHALDGLGVGCDKE